MKDKILKEWEEVVGKLTAVKDEGYAITLVFTTVWHVEVPRLSNALIKKFNRMIGMKIGVLRTDVPGKEVLCREIQKEEGQGE